MIAGPICQVSLARLRRAAPALTNSHYDSLQVSLTRRFSRGVTITANYTYGRSIDTISDDQQNPTAVSFSNSNNLNLDRSVSDFTTLHRFVVSYVWELPAVNRWGLLGKEILSGWQLNGITDLHTGNPLNIVSGIDSNLDAIATDRPDVIGDPRLDTGNCGFECSRVEKAIDELHWVQFALKYQF
jgi:hypothetical protein